MKHVFERLGQDGNEKVLPETKVWSYEKFMDILIGRDVSTAARWEHSSRKFKFGALLNFG